MSDEATIEAGKVAWSRISTATTFDAWKAIAAALEVGRLCSMRDAKINVAFGTKYRRAMNAWTAANGFADMPFSYRSACHVLIGNISEIERWRNALPPEARANHVQVIIRNWRRATSPPRCVESRPAKDAKSNGNVRPIYWSQDHLRRAHKAMIDSRSSDLLKLARCALEGAIRDQGDLLSLLSTDNLPPRPAAIAAPIAALMPA
jgi:hypothetical protein